MGKVEVTNKDSITGDGSCPSLVREDSSFLYAVASECENDDAERFSGTPFATVDIGPAGAVISQATWGSEANLATIPREDDEAHFKRGNVNRSSRI